MFYHILFCPRVSPPKYVEENQDGSFSAYAPELEDYKSNLPSSPTRFFAPYLDFDQNRRLVRANIELMGKRIVLGKQIDLASDHLLPTAE